MRKATKAELEIKIQRNKESHREVIQISNLL
jgi:hypothetical protein